MYSSIVFGISGVVHHQYNNILDPFITKRSLCPLPIGMEGGSSRGWFAWLLHPMSQDLSRRWLTPSYFQNVTQPSGSCPKLHSVIVHPNSEVQGHSIRLKLSMWGVRAVLAWGFKWAPTTWGAQQGCQPTCPVM